MPGEVQSNGTFIVPTAPVSWQRDVVPHPRYKRYDETRPNDFRSLKDVPARDDLIRLVIGRLLSEDGHDMQDDYTLPIEKQFWHRSLSFIFKHTYCESRGIRDPQAVVRVRFMLDEAGSGLGWFDMDQTPLDLGLKDTDIVEVLVTRPEVAEPKGIGATLASFDEVTPESAVDWSPQSWKEAVAFFDEVKRSGHAQPELWIPKLWIGLNRYAEDDNVVMPGLDCLRDFLNEGQDQALPHRGRRLAALANQDRVDCLQRILGYHSKNWRVQEVGWRLLAELATEPPLQPLLVQRKGIRALAAREQRVGELPGQALAACEAVLQALNGVSPPKPGLAAPSPFLMAQKKAVKARNPSQEEAFLPAEDKAHRSLTLGNKLQTSLNERDMLAVDKTLRLLLRRIRGGELDSKSLRAAGIGPLLGQLRGFEGDADIRDLAQQAISEMARLLKKDELKS